jgi:hypothetical protein
MGIIRSSGGGSFISAVKDASRHRRLFLLTLQKEGWVLAKLAKIEGCELSFHILSSQHPEFGFVYLERYEFDYSLSNQDYGITFGGNAMVQISASDALEEDGKMLLVNVEDNLSEAFMDALGKSPNEMSSRLHFFKCKIVDVSVKDLPLYLDNARPKLDQILKGKSKAT